MRPPNNQEIMRFFKTSFRKKREKSGLLFFKTILRIPPETNTLQKSSGVVGFLSILEAIKIVTIKNDKH